MAAEGGGTVVVVAVLPGSLVDPGLPPEEAGRIRRHHEERAVAEARAQVRGVGPPVSFEVIAVFGDVAFDTLLVAENLGADAIVAGAADPATVEMSVQSSIPVVVVA